MATRRLPRSAFHLHAPVQLQDDAGDKPSGENGSGSREWSGIAYSGEALKLGPFDDERLVIDLETMRGIDRKLPALIGHDRGRIAGYTESVEAGEALEVRGRLLSSTADGRQVAQASDEGFPWQLSIDARPGRVEEVASGEEVTVNGRQLAGPLVVFRDTQVREVSFTPTGVDHNTLGAALSDDPETITVETEEAGMGTKDNTSDQGTPTVAQLQEQLAAERQAREAAEAQLAEERRARREDEVRHLFADLGREYTEEAAAPYVQMSDEAWQAVSRDMRAQAPAQSAGATPPSAPDRATLQRETATGEPHSEQLSDEEIVAHLASL